MSRTINEVAALATKVRAALRIERNALTASNKDRAAFAIGNLAAELSDEQLTRLFDVMAAAETFDLDAYNADRAAYAN